jgi:hypothetical protein
MNMNDPEINEAIEADQKEHPTCRYSTSYNSMCRSVNGNYQCENVRSLQRICPQQRPVEIFKKTDKLSEGGESFQNPVLDNFGPSFLDGILGSFGFPSHNKSRHHFDVGDDFFDSILQRGKALNDPFDLRSDHNHSSVQRPNTSPELCPPHHLPRGQAPSSLYPGSRVKGYTIGPPENI